ncbi:MAG: alpha/beta fold hydrolase, partial [Perlucidibaca sp.]
DKAAQAGFMVAYPEGSGRFGRLLTWNAGSCCGYAQQHGVDDVAFLVALMDRLTSRHDIDPQRIFVVGMSNGGMMAYRLAAEHPERVAAVASVAGTLAIPPASVRAPVPVLHFHGSADENVPYEGGIGRHSLAGVTHASVETTLAAWIRADGANSRPQITALPDRADDGTQVTRYRYASPADPGAVTLYRIAGGGHTWPGRAGHERLLGASSRDISANDILWDYFRAHVRQDKGAGAPLR